MPRQRKPPRLIERPGYKDWYIRDAGRTLSTFTADRGEAERCLARYVASKIALPPEPTIFELLRWRLAISEKKGQARSKSVTRGYHKTLEPFFGPLLPEQITPELVAQYIAERNAVGVSGRHELIELKATLNAAVRRKAIASCPHID